MIDYGSFIRTVSPSSPVAGKTYWFDANSPPGAIYGWNGSAWTLLTTSGPGGSGPSNTDSLSEGSTNLYFTNERAQDGVSSMFIANTGDIAFTYGDAANVISTLVKSSAITFNKFQNAAQASVLLGAGSTGSGAPYSEITLGSNLSMSGTVLYASSGTSVVNTGFNLTVREEDGSPTVASVTVLRFPNASVTVNGSGDVSVAIVGSAAAGALMILRPQQYEPPSSFYATLDLRNSHPVLDFDASSDEEAMWSGVLPVYAGGGLTVQTWWGFTSATSGSLRVQAAIERMGLSSLDTDADSFAAFQSAGGTAPATNGQLIRVDVTMTDGAQINSLTAGDAFRLKLRRDADGTSGTDDIATDAELFMVLVKEP